MNFQTIASGQLTPFVAAEFDNTQANQGAAELPYRALLIGQKLAAGTWAANTLQRVTNADQVAAGAGRGSQLHRQAKAWFAQNKSTEVWCGVLADDGAAVAASGTLTVSGPAIASGTIYLYVHGVLVKVAVSNGDSANAIATAIGAAINANADLAVTTTVATNVVTVTARNKGPSGNSLDLRVNYQDTEALPAGVAVVVVAMASGATAPSLTALIAALGDTWFHVWAHPYTDATSLSAIEAELTSRWGGQRMIDGLAITSANGTQSTLGTLGLTRNSPNSCIVAQPGKNPLVPPAEFAAAVAAVVALSGSQDPGLPFQTLPLVGVLPPARADLFLKTERNLNLVDGIATTLAGVDGVVRLERIVTTYQTNAAGTADGSYRDATTLLNLMYLRYAFVADVQQKYARYKLADDGTPVAPGQPIITPKLMKAECVHWFENMMELGLVQSIDTFKANLVVQRNAQDRNRLDVLLPPSLINQLMGVAADVQFRV